MPHPTDTAIYEFKNKKFRLVRARVHVPLYAFNLVCYFILFLFCLYIKRHTYTHPVKMNLMFRKNFREGGAGKSSSSGIKLTTKAQRSQGKRSRDMGYGNLDADVHYRTHLFFSPNRGFNSNNCEGLCTI